jgi:hypothetical protein
LRQDHRIEIGHKGVDAFDNLVAVGDRERTFRAEVVLDIDDEKDVGHGKGFPIYVVLG